MVLFGTKIKSWYLIYPAFTYIIESLCYSAAHVSLLLYSTPFVCMYMYTCMHMMKII